MLTINNQTVADFAKKCVLISPYLPHALEDLVMQHLYSDSGFYKAGQPLVWGWEEVLSAVQSVMWVYLGMNSEMDRCDDETEKKYLNKLKEMQVFESEFLAAYNAEHGTNHQPLPELKTAIEEQEEYVASIRK